MKKFTLVAALMVLLCGTSLAAKEFDWSQCWCNYGGGIKQGDFIVNADVGLFYDDLSLSSYDGFWFFPPVMVEVQYAQPIWKLPFTFGGYAGLHGWGYSYSYPVGGETYRSKKTFMAFFFGGEAAYHIQMPPKGLDLYAVTRLGFNIPVKNTYYDYYSSFVDFGEAIGANWFFSDFFGLNFEIGYPFTKFGATFKF